MGTARDQAGSSRRPSTRMGSVESVADTVGMGGLSWATVFDGANTRKAAAIARKCPLRRRTIDRSHPPRAS